MPQALLKADLMIRKKQEKPEDPEWERLPDIPGLFEQLPAAGEFIYTADRKGSRQFFRVLAVMHRDCMMDNLPLRPHHVLYVEHSHPTIVLKQAEEK